jgi:lysine 2,3-aminomutase
MKEKVTPYIKELLGYEAIKAQYAVSGCEPANGGAYTDPLMEDSHEVVKGLVHKYPNRALIKVSYQCAAHCRFCTRIRQIGDPAGTLTTGDIAAITGYLLAHPEIDDVILSGGDPFYTSVATRQLLQQLQQVLGIKVLRLGTRLPLQLPSAFASAGILDLLEDIREIGLEKPVYLLLHINHPAELTTEALAVIAQLRRYPVTLLSQTVFLKAVNDSFEVLYELYTRLYHAGVVPYYLYHCDAVQGIGHFAVPMETERAIVTRLTAALSGIACPTYVIDVGEGYGKIPVPLTFIDQEGGSLTDFRGQVHML